MPKHAIKIPPHETGRRVRWMLEVSAAAGEDVVSARKTSRKHTRSKRMKKPATARTAPVVSVATGRGILVGGVVAVGAALALMGYPSIRRASVAANIAQESLAQRVDVPKSAASEPRPASRATAPTAVTAAPVSKAKVEEKAEQAPVAPIKRWPPPDPVSSPPPAVAAARAAHPSDPETVVPEQIPDARVSAATSFDAASPTVTISGCLETTVDESQFRLTDTQGVDAPKARSWRTGFLKRRSTAVKLAEFSDALALRKHVGHRVVATGLLAGQELRVRSLQADGSSCD